MGWETIIPIIAQYGIPLAENLFQKWTSGSLPTQADFDELRKLASQTASDRTKARLVAAGIDLNSDQAKQILAMVA